MAAKLILSMNGVVVQEHVLDKEHMTIGRKPHNDIVIDNLAVSGEHAAIVTIFNDSFLEDLNSTNGTLVNGAPIKNHFLQNSDVIEMGKYKLKYLNDQKIQSAVADFEKTMVFRESSRIAAATPVTADSSETTLKLNPAELQQLTLAEKLPELQTGAVTSSQPALVIPAKKVVADSAAASDGEAVSQPVHATSAEKVADPLQVMGVIQIFTGPNAGKELELVKNLTTVGKSGVQVVVFTRRPRGYFITYVEGESYPNLNGKPMDDQPCQLKEHDIIELAGIKIEFYLKS
jgi:pSer/pThr/pTyr-binding forkhead associated (FHA) protein